MAIVLNPIFSGYIHVYQSHTVTHVFYVHTHFNGLQCVKVRTLPRVGIKNKFLHKALAESPSPVAHPEAEEKWSVMRESHK